MKLYYPKDHYNPKFRGRLFPLLKPFIKKDSFTDDDRMSLYSVSNQDYTFVDTIEDADKVILTMAWNYYLQFNTTSRAIQVFNMAKQFNKEVWVIMLDDFGLKFPDLDYCKVFRLSGYRSRLPKNHVAIPAFINDPLKDVYKSAAPFKRSYHKKPIVGFCGLANDSIFYILEEWFKIAYRNMKHYLGLGYVESEHLISPSYLRTKILRRLKKSNNIEDNFIIRKKYRAGVTNKGKKDPTRIAFFDNIKNSDYVLCVRGAGNFSVRFYETLAMGRIPVFINTDCLLPLTESINWKDHVVWVEYDELVLLEEKIISFHEKLDNNKLNELFIKNRLLWENKLRMGPYFNSFKSQSY